jgi:hypothetical protein
MRKLGVLMVTFFNCCALFSSPQVDNKYIGKTLDQIIKKLGTPNEITEKIIDKDYIGYESEPEYSKYFSPIELENSVIIKVASWQKKKTTTIWLKKQDDLWIVFSSLYYDSATSF